MIDISHKKTTLRYARVRGELKTTPEVIKTIKANKVPKGDVLQVARAAGIQAAKNTASWMVFSHTMPIDWAEITYNIGESSIEVFAEVRAVWKTGVEMEAMTAACGALLNMYDMLKPLDPKAEIGSVALLEKTGGKSDYTDMFPNQLQAALLLVSDAVVSGKKDDTTSEPVTAFLEKNQIEVAYIEILEEDAAMVEEKMSALADSGDYQFLITLGSTGPADHDFIHKTTQKVIEKEVPGIAEAIREHGRRRTPYAMFSGGVSGIRNKTLILNLPGSSRGAMESLQALFPGLAHIVLMMHKGKVPGS